MGRVTEPLALFGAEARGRRGGRLPITLTGAANPMPVQYTTPVPSAQVKSAVLLAGLNAPGETVVIEKEPTRDHTERMLAGFGATVATEATPEGRVITLRGQPELRPQAIAVPRDPSSAAFPVAAALLVEGSEIVAAGDRAEPDARRALRRRWSRWAPTSASANRREEGGEPVADLRGALLGAEGASRCRRSGRPR